MSGEEKKKHKKETVTISKEEHEKLIHLAEECKDKYLRAHAELDNAKKRFAKEKEEFLKFANEDLLIDLLYVIDNFDRALAHMNGTQKVESVLQGVAMIQKQFHQLLEQKGVKRIESLGRKFDPAFHEAIEHVETEDQKDGVVLEEVQAGYLLNERLLRPAVVKVSKAKETKQ